MNLIEALKSGKHFKLKGFNLYYKVDNNGNKIQVIPGNNGITVLQQDPYFSIAEICGHWEIIEDIFSEDNEVKEE